MKTVSVLIPSFNHAFFIKQAVESVLSQTFTDYELLISDDHSSDNTLEVLRQFRGKKNIQIFEQSSHLGAVEQIHFLAQHAQGKYIALLNSDDYWYPQKLEKQVVFLENTPHVGACFSHTVMVDDHSRILSPKEFPLSDIFIQPNRSRLEWIMFFLTKGNALAHPSVLARAGIYKDEYRLNYGLRQLPDFDLWTRYLIKNEIHVLPEKLTAHRRVEKKNTSAWTRENNRLLYREQAWIRCRLINNLPIDDFRILFQSQLRNADCQDPIEILCEKFFLLKDMGQTDNAMREQAISFYLNHSQNAKFVETIVNTYGFNDLEFFSFSKSVPFSIAPHRTISQRIHLFLNRK